MQPTLLVLGRPQATIIIITTPSSLARAEPVLNFLLAGLRVDKLATVSARALRAVCAQCDRQMTGHLNGLVQIVQALDSFNIASDAAVGILEGTAKVRMSRGGRGGEKVG